jgi:adenylate kinase
MTARGESVRADDNPDALHRRLVAYREQTAPLVAYYQLQGQLRTVDGMAPIDEVEKAIDALLRSPKKPANSAKPAAKPAAGAAAQPRGSAARKKASGGAGKAPKTARKVKTVPRKAKAKSPAKAGSRKAAARAPKRLRRLTKRR